VAGGVAVQDRTFARDGWGGRAYKESLLVGKLAALYQKGSGKSKGSTLCWMIFQS